MIKHINLSVKFEIVHEEIDVNRRLSFLYSYWHGQYNKSGEKIKAHCVNDLKTKNLTVSSQLFVEGKTSGQWSSVLSNLAYLELLGWFPGIFFFFFFFYSGYFEPPVISKTSLSWNNIFANPNRLFPLVTFPFISRTEYKY